MSNVIDGRHPRRQKVEFSLNRVRGILELVEKGLPATERTRFWETSSKEEIDLSMCIEAEIRTYDP